MPHVRKAWLICDNCEEQIEIDPAIENPFHSTIIKREENYKDWSEVQGTQILCPKCAEAYFKEEKKCREKLKKMAGLKTFLVSF